MNYALDHVGIAVTDLDQALEEYRRNFGFHVDLRELIESQKVELAFLKLPSTKIELLMPTDPSSPLQKFLDKSGPGLHHVCYRVEDIEAELQRLEQLGHQLIDRTPRPGAHGSRIAFIHPKTLAGVLTELCQY